MKRAFVKTALIISLAIPAYAGAIIAPSPICTQEYAPVCGQKYSNSGITRNTYSNMCQLNADGASFMSHGACDQNPYNPYYPYNPYTPYNPYPYNPQPYYPYYGSAPSIQSFTGPTTLRTSETGTWYVNVGTSTGTLTYSIIWGDEVTYAYANAQSLQNYTTQQTTFSHSYANPGTYTVIITARDTMGRTAQASATVTVYSNTTTPYYPPTTPYYPPTIPYHPPYNPYQYNYNYSYWNSDNNYNDVDDWDYWWERSNKPTSHRRKVHTQYDYNYNYNNSYDDYYGSSYGGQYYDDYNYYNNSFNYDDSGWYPDYSYTWQ